MCPNKERFITNIIDKRNERPTAEQSHYEVVKSQNGRITSETNSHQQINNPVRNQEERLWRF